MKKKGWFIIITFLAGIGLLNPALSLAQTQTYSSSTTTPTGDPGAYDSRVDVGGSYSVPNLPPTANPPASIGVNGNLGMSCGQINWDLQLKQQLQKYAAMLDIKQLGQTAVAASESYLMSALRPTFMETIQNLLKNANAKIAVYKNSCRQMEASLNKDDPLGIMKRRHTSQQAMQNANNGEPFGQAVKDASNASYSWSADKEINKSNMDTKSKGMLTAFLGDVSVQVGNGQQSVSDQANDKHMVDRGYAGARSKVESDLLQRFTTGANCDQPLLVSTSSTTTTSNSQPLNNVSAYDVGDQAYVSVANDNNVKVNGVTDSSTGLLTIPASQMPQLKQDLITASIENNVKGTSYPETSCDAFAYMNQIGMPYGYRAQFAAMYADSITLRGLATTIDELRTKVNQMKVTSKNHEGWKMMDGQVAALQDHYNQLKDQMNMENQQMKDQLQAKEEILLAKARAREQQGNDVQQVLDNQVAHQTSPLINY